MPEPTLGASPPPHQSPFRRYIPDVDAMLGGRIAQRVTQ
jgi:hypothetical protein